MSDHDLPPSDAVPDQVLDELMAAFGHDGTAAEALTEYDFDDPSIDRLLGLGDTADASPRRVIVIEDSDQPDTVYLDEEAEQRLRDTHGSAGEGDRSTIVIDDLDAAGGDAATAAPSSSIDPRLRARRIAVRRAEGRRRLVWVAVVAAVVLVAVGTVAVFASSWFAVTQVDVEGAVYTDPERLQAVVDDLMDTPVLLVDTRAAERELESIPWVETARVRTDFPHRVVIEIREREPVATFQGADGRFRVIDRDGRVLDVLDGNPIAYMLLTGDHPDTDQGLFAGPPYKAAAQLVIALPGEIRRMTTSVGLDNVTGSLSLVLEAPGDGHEIDVHLGDASALPDKLARLLQVVHRGLDTISRIDVSTGEVSVVPR